ncbi:unnamed protein product [Strongylus vulgaris]|uniref:Uncharacterized protein n=1 Tax=Strongylus vulgaris TaxID=40348 RepID=A0A3P7LRQ1_STRVU|nr:unnamed protein product [Strongylus vulgaris]
MSPYAIFVLLALLAITSAKNSDTISVGGPFDWNNYNYTSGNGNGTISVKVPNGGNGGNNNGGNNGQPGDEDDDYHPNIPRVN